VRLKNLKNRINHPVPTFLSGHPSFRKEGKVKIINILTFSSSSEESLLRFGGEYPDNLSGGGGELLIENET
jgi:hypothetical protein